MISRMHRTLGYFSGCQGRHADIHSTLPGERFHAMKEEWTSYGAWGYKNLGVDALDIYTHLFR
jgi:hypothetical protein